MDVFLGGNITLDIIPGLEGREGGLGEMFVPGKNIHAGPTLLASGGSTANTGLALHRLGFDVQMSAKVGNDYFGRVLTRIISEVSPDFASGISVIKDESTAHTFIITMPGKDRIFIHHPGVNNTYGAEDVDDARLDAARIFHIGYPSSLRRIWINDGAELIAIFRKAKNHETTTSLDVAKPDPDSPAGKIDWNAYMMGVLPFVDIFLPSFDETVYMLEPSTHHTLVETHGAENIIEGASVELLRRLAGKLVNYGVAVAGIKLGDRGLYVRTADVDRMARAGKCSPVLTSWADREIQSPCFHVEARGTTGAGDCTISGFLAGLLRAHTLENTVEIALGAGASCVETVDATSGIPTLDDLVDRINNGWAKRE